MIAAFAFVNCQKCNAFPNRVILRFSWISMLYGENSIQVGFKHGMKYSAHFYITNLWYHRQNVLTVWMLNLFSTDNIHTNFLFWARRITRIKLQQHHIWFYYRLITFDIFIAYSYVRVRLCCSHISFNVPFNNKILRHKKVKVFLSFKTLYMKSKV